MGEYLSYPVYGQLNCVVTFTDDLAMKQARQADQEIAAGRYRGPLHGIPWGCKDIIAVPGYPTTWGSGAFKDQMIETEVDTSLQGRRAPLPVPRSERERAQEQPRRAALRPHHKRTSNAAYKIKGRLRSIAVVTGERAAEPTVAANSFDC